MSIPTPNTQNPIPGAQRQAPIADVTYRTYDGPLKLRAARWWIIAVARIRYLRTRWWFWLLVVFSLMPYVLSGLMLYIQSQMQNGPRAMLNNPFMDSTPGQKYAMQFYLSMAMQAFWVFIIGLAAGAGSIASDNRANALLVYLSKP